MKTIYFHKENNLQKSQLDIIAGYNHSFEIVLSLKILKVYSAFTCRRTYFFWMCYTQKFFWKISKVYVLL